MLSVTVRSCLEAFKGVPYQCEIVIVDNSDEDIYKFVKGAIPSGYFRDKSVKCYRQDEPCLFTARDMAAFKATGEYLVCLDSHMLVGYNMFNDLIDFMDKTKDKPVGFAHAPISWAHQHENHAKHDRDVISCELGDWNTKYDHERKITFKGMPWICNREWYLNTLEGYGALAEHKLSWGGGDFYIGIKSWLLGYPNYSVNTSPGIHIGPFPKIKGKHPDTYRLYSKSGTYHAYLGFLVALYAIGGDEAIDRNSNIIKNRFKYNVETNRATAKKLAESDKRRIAKDCVITFQELLDHKPWEMA